MRITEYAVYYDNCFAKIKKTSKIQYKLRSMATLAENEAHVYCQRRKNKLGGQK